MALKFRHLSVPQAQQALRYRVVNSLDLTSSQSSHERHDAVGQCGHDTRRHSRRHRHPNWPLSSMLLPPQRHRFRQTAFESAVERDRSLCCAFCRNMNSNVSVELDPSRTNVRVTESTWNPRSGHYCKDQQEALLKLQIPQQITFKYLPQRIPEHSSEISQTLRKFATWIHIKLPVSIT